MHPYTHCPGLAPVWAVPALVARDLVLGIGEGTSGGTTTPASVQKYGGSAEAIGKAIDRRQGGVRASLRSWRMG